MYIIVGLGNPGSKYQYNRHNIGFMILEELLKDLTVKKQSVWSDESEFQCKMARLQLPPPASAYAQALRAGSAKADGGQAKVGELILMKPQTYMNASGGAVRIVTNFYKIVPENVIVIHDDIDLPLGKIRIRRGGGSAGHNGVKSIISNLGSAEFIRVRLGVGRGKLDVVRSSARNLHRRAVEEYVLSPFTKHEGGEVRKLIKGGVEAVETLLKDGLEKAMNKFN